MSWLSVAQVAIHLGISKETVYRLLKRKAIPSLWLGKLHKFNTQEIDAWVMKGKVK